MSIISNSAEIKSHASSVRTQAEQAQTEFTSMKARLESISSSFQGAGATAFQERWNEWHTNATGLVTALNGLAAFLDTAADTFDEADRSIAGAAQG